MSVTDIQTGAVFQGDKQCHFTLWGPELESVELKIVSPKPATYPLQKSEDGVWSATLDAVEYGTQYLYRIDNADERPDPASRYQPEGVHGPSMVIDPRAYDWQEGDWKNIPLQDYIIYELHIGTFTAVEVIILIEACE